MPDSGLSTRHCVPCTGTVPKLWGYELESLAKQVPQWRLVSEHHLERAFTFADFKGALAFTNQIAAVAEAEGHHPDLLLTWGKVEVKLWTHKIDGLTESDFVLAARIDALPR